MEGKVQERVTEEQVQRSKHGQRGPEGVIDVTGDGADATHGVRLSPNGVVGRRAAVRAFRRPSRGQAERPPQVRRLARWATTFLRVFEGHFRFAALEWEGWADDPSRDLRGRKSHPIGGWFSVTSSASRF